MLCHLMVHRSSGGRLRVSIIQHGRRTMEEGECLILGISVSLVTMLEASKETGFKNMKMSPLIFNNMSNLFTAQSIRLVLVRNKSLTLF